jgi:hypothetical protein
MKIRDTIKTATTNGQCAFIRRHRITVAAIGTGSKPATECANTMATTRDADMTAAERDACRGTKAREQIARAYNAFTEIFEKPDLLAAKILMTAQWKQKWQ